MIARSVTFRVFDYRVPAQNPASLGKKPNKEPYKSKPKDYIKFYVWNIIILGSKYDFNGIPCQLTQDAAVFTDVSRKLMVNASMVFLTLQHYPDNN